MVKTGGLFQVDPRPFQAALDEAQAQLLLAESQSSQVPTDVRLAPHHRPGIIMRDVENWSCVEIAGVFRVSLGGVKTRLHRARLFIRKRLAESRPGRSHGAPAEPRDQRGKRPW